MKTTRHLWSYLAQFWLKSEIFQTKDVEIKPHILHSLTFFYEKRAVYGIIWKDITERGRPQMTT